MESLSKYRKLLNGGIALLFLWMVVIQLNDPDPVFWVAIYGLVMVISAMSIFDRINAPILMVALCICIGGALYLAPSVVTWLLENDFGDIVSKMSTDRPYIEEARECIGLIMAAAALIYINSQAKLLKPIFNPKRGGGYEVSHQSDPK